MSNSAIFCSNLHLIEYAWHGCMLLQRRLEGLAAAAALAAVVAAVAAILAAAAAAAMTAALTACAPGRWRMRCCLLVSASH
jgi:hypothetical protein